MAKTARLERDWNDEATIGTIKHLATGEVLTLDLSNVNGDDLTGLHETNRKNFIHGWHQKVGDALSASTGNDSEDFDKLASVHERFISGDWAKERESTGPRPTLVAEAVVRAMVKKNGGNPLPAEHETAIRAMFTGKGTEQARADIVKDPAVAREMLAIKTEREEARIAKLAESGASALDALKL